jgi:NAD(P)H dehydrogenase (quinone)
MRILVLYAHPLETSFGAALHGEVVKTLRARGHEVDDCDLNAEGFDPVLSRQDRLNYYDLTRNRARVAPYVDRLLAAEALVLIFPVWNYGYPAILKGVFDKVFLPGVSFTLNGVGGITPILHNIKRMAAVCTYGGSRWRSIVMGDPPRRIFNRSLRALVAANAKRRYLAHYDMNRTTPDKRARFLAEVRGYFSGW